MQFLHSLKSSNDDLLGSRFGSLELTGQATTSGRFAEAHHQNVQTLKAEEDHKTKQSDQVEDNGLLHAPTKGSSYCRRPFGQPVWYEF